jgi:hypothetical protein
MGNPFVHPAGKEVGHVIWTIVGVLLIIVLLAWLI